MRGKTGEKCIKSGVYFCEKHPSSTINIQHGDTFPPCQSDNDHGATWVLSN